MASASTDDGSGSDDSSGHLHVWIRTKPHPEAGCPLSDINCKSEDIRQTIVRGDECDRCRLEVTSVDGERYFLDGSVGDRCIGLVLSRYDCIATIEAVENGELTKLISVPDRSELQAIMSSLRNIGVAPDLLHIAGSTPDANDPVFKLAIDSLTTKQRAAVRVAVESGYYDSPRKADLSDLADELEISRSAVSQRLTTVESKLINTLYDADRYPHAND